MERYPLADRDDRAHAAWIVLLRFYLLRHRCRVLLHRMLFPGQPMFSEKAALDLIGKRILVWVIYEDEHRQRVRDEEYQGRIVRANRQEGIVIQTPSGSQRTVPADLCGIFRAPGRTAFDFWSSWAFPLSWSEESPHR